MTAAISRQYGTAVPLNSIMQVYGSNTVFDGCNFTAALTDCAAVRKSSNVVVLQFYGVVVSGTAPKSTRSEKNAQPSSGIDQKQKGEGQGHWIPCGRVILCFKLSQPTRSVPVCLTRAETFRWTPPPAVAGVAPPLSLCRRVVSSIVVFFCLL